MNINYNKLNEFITNLPDVYWDKRSIPLKEICEENLEELTLEEIDNLLDQINVKLYEDGNDCFYFTFKMFIDDDGYTRYLLEMKYG